MLLISHWLLPMLNGLEATRLSLCKVATNSDAQENAAKSCTRAAYRRADDRNGAQRVQTQLRSNPMTVHIILNRHRSQCIDSELII